MVEQRRQRSLQECQQHEGTAEQLGAADDPWPGPGLLAHARAVDGRRNVRTSSVPASTTKNTSTAVPAMVAPAAVS